MNNIKKIRKEKGLSVTELAKAINMSQSNLTKIENNQIIPKDEIYTKIAEALGISPEAIRNKPTKSSECNLLPIINSTEIGIPDLSLYPMPTYIFNQNPLDLCVYIAKNDSMQPTIANGAVVVINKKQQTFQQNGIYLLKINNKHALRRLQETENNQIHIITDNKNYLQQTAKLNELEIVGQAIYILNPTIL